MKGSNSAKLSLNDSPSISNHKIIYLNICSARNKIEELELLTSTHSPDILCLSEHWLSPHETGHFKINNFCNVQFYCRSQFTHGGVAILAKPHVLVSPLPEVIKFCTDKDFECVGAIWQLPKHPTTVILSLYRSPKGDIHTFLSKLDDVLTHVLNKHKNSSLLLCGDFNINFLASSHQKTLLLDLLQTFHLHATVQSPTRCSGSSATTIDNIFTNISNSLYAVEVTDPGLSDHSMVTISLSVPVPKNNTFKWQRLFTPGNISYFRNLLVKYEWQFLDSFEDPNEQYNAFFRVFEHCFKIAFPRTCKKYSGSPSKSPWLNPDLVREAQSLRSLHIAIKQAPNNHDLKQYYTKKKSEHAKNIRRAKLHFNDLQIYNSNNKVKAAWKVVKLQTQAPHPKKNMSLILNNITISDPCTVSEHFNSFFLGPLPAVSPNTNHQFSTPCPPPPSPIHNKHSLYLSPTTPSEIYYILLGLKSKHSSGMDDIPGSLLSKCADILAYPLSSLVNVSLTQGVVPDKLKEAKVIPIYKGKGAKSDPNSFRPISILPSFSKVYEIIYYRRALSFVSHHKIFSCTQHGFQKDKSTSTAIYSFLMPLYSALDKDHHAVGLFYDLQKAFDTINHSVLLNKLETIGIRGTARDWISSYLTNRKQCVEVQSNNEVLSSFVRSTPKVINKGVPQGSILGPFLFLLYINDMSKFFSVGTLTQFADDSSHLISVPTHQYNILSSTLNQQVSAMASYCHINHLSLSSAKTTFLSFHNKHRPPLCSPLVRINDKSIQRTNQVKFLGVVVTETLEWSKQVEHVVSKLTTGCYLMARLKQIVHPHILKCVYFAHLHSHITYGILFWGASSHAKRVFILQKRAIRILAGISRRTSCRPYFSQLKIMTLTCTLIYIASVFVRLNAQFFSQNTSHHSHDTRAKSLIHIPSFDSSIFSQSPFYSATKIYNRLPKNIINSGSVLSFKNNLKTFLLSNSFYNLQEYMSV